MYLVPNGLQVNLVPIPVPRSKSNIVPGNNPPWSAIIWGCMEYMVYNYHHIICNATQEVT